MIIARPNGERAGEAIDVAHTYITAGCRFAWGGIGGEDCTTWVASYALLLTGMDPAQEFRGKYADKAGAHAIVAAHGGLLNLVSPSLHRLGWKRVTEPQHGDIAVINAVVDADMDVPIRGDVSAIRFGPLWSAMGPTGPRGIAPRKAPIIAVWRWPNCTI